MWIGRHAIVAIALTAANACSDTTPGEPRFAELCGVEGPVRLYEPVVTNPAQGFEVRQVRKADDRWLVSLSARPEPFAEVGPEDHAGWFDHRVVSIDECGGDPREVLRGQYWFNEAPDGTWFACVDDVLTTFDPRGEAPSRSFPEFIGCASLGTPDHLVTLDERDDGMGKDLYTVAFENGEPVASLLDERLVAWDVPAPFPTSRPLLTVNEAGELAEIDPGSGSRIVRFDGVTGLVTWFARGRGDRFVAYSPDTEDWLPIGDHGTWFLWDRDADTQRRIGDPAEGSVKLWATDGGIVASQETSAGETRLFFDAGAPDGIEVDIDLWLSPPRPDGHRLLRPQSEGGLLQLMDPDGRLHDVGDVADQGEVWIDGDDFLLSTRIAGHHARVRSMWRMSPDDDAPRRVVEYAVSPMSLGDRLWATVLDFTPAAATSGDLVIVDEGNPEPFVVDHDVETNLRPSNGVPTSLDDPPPAIDGPLLYTVQDPSGERSGLYMVSIERG